MITMEKAAGMLAAKIECMTREASGTDLDCSLRNCDECNICYEQGTTGEQIEALQIAVKALSELNAAPHRVPEL